MSDWKVEATKILTAGEIAQILADLKRRARRSANSRMNLIIFRLATCCGLRVSELIGLRMGDVRVGMAKPYIHVRAEVAKRNKPRRVPLWWDQGTLDDLTAWRDERVKAGAGPAGPFISSRSGRPLDRQNARHRFKVACRCLGVERVRDLTVHHGRHSFVTHALRGGRSLAEVRDSAGHANIATTSLYAHVAQDDDGRVGDLFAFGA
ncbi:MAG: site-specific integrase [Planctomycetota bacterium]